MGVNFMYMVHLFIPPVSRVTCVNLFASSGDIKYTDRAVNNIYLVTSVDIFLNAHG